ncbi:MAG: PilW family protein [Gammaproteobacteria bacterium]|nr:PilW family protein [Gammaproteobacteria bacterium]
MKSAKTQSGVSLVEVLVAVAISGILLAGVVQIFLSTRQAYTTMDAASRLQEDGRFAINFLADELRRAGYYGCNSRQLGDEAPDLEAFDTATSTGDTLALRVPLTESFTLTADADTTPFTVNVDRCAGEPSDDIQTGMDVVLADCRGAMILQDVDVECPTAEEALITPTATLGRTFGANLTEVYRIATRVYYVDLNGDGVPALFRRTDTEAPMELVSGVETMAIRYGVDENGNGFANRYTNAPTEWENVVSVQIALLIRSIEPVKTSPEEPPRPHCLLGDPMDDDCDGGTAINPNDRYMRHVYTTTIALRNRIPVGSP